MEQTDEAQKTRMIYASRNQMNRVRFAASVMDDAPVLYMSGTDEKLPPEVLAHADVIEVVQSGIGKYRIVGTDAAKEAAAFSALSFTDGQFGTAILINTLDPMTQTERRDCIREVRRTVTVGGRLLIGTAVIKPEEMRALLADAFAHITVYSECAGNYRLIADDTGRLFSAWENGTGVGEYSFYLAAQENTSAPRRAQLETDAAPVLVGDTTVETALRRQLENLNMKMCVLRMQNEEMHKKATELARIEASHTYRFSRRLARTCEKLAPVGSRRRLVLKYAIKTLRHPVTMVKRLNSVNSRVFFRNLRQGTLVPASVADNPPVVQAFPVVEQPGQHRGKADFPHLTFERQEQPLVSIIIPVYNQFDYTYACLRSILTNTLESSYEVIIADDSSTDLTREIGDIVRNIRVVRTSENLRFLRNCNHAAQSARGKYLLFLNNDTQVQENWLSSLISLIEGDATIGAVGSRLVYADGHLQEAGGIVWRDGTAWNYGRMDDPNKADYNFVRDVDYVSGASLMIRTQLFRKIGGFDEQFAPAYYEDTDLAFAVRAQGYRVVYQPASIVIHFEGISNGTDTSAGQKKYQEINVQKFREKWADELALQYENGDNVFLARNRSSGKKHMLVVDHYVPHYDKDAGGRCTYMYIKLFLAMGLSVTFIGDDFHPHQPYTNELGQMGVEVLYGVDYFSGWQKYLAANGRYFDYAYLNRPHIAIKYIDILRRHSNCKIIYFGHDLHYLRVRRQYEVEGGKALLNESREWEKKEKYLFTHSDVIYAVGSYEQGIIAKMVPDKTVRNIPVYFYDQVPAETRMDFSARQDLLFVGGFGHEPNADAVIWMVETVLPVLLKRDPEIVLHVVGSNPTEKVRALAGKNVEIVGFVSDEELNELYQKYRMAVIPLRFGAGVKGKIIEAAYHQLPVVTTPIGVEGLSMAEGAFCVTEPDAGMADVIDRLYHDEAALADYAARERTFIRNYFTRDTALKLVQQDIKTGNEFA